MTFADVIRPILSKIPEARPKRVYLHPKDAKDVLASVSGLWEASADMTTMLKSSPLMRSGGMEWFADPTVKEGEPLYAAPDLHGEGLPKR